MSEEETEALTPFVIATDANASKTPGLSSVR